MPNDENNGVNPQNPQNQQANPNLIWNQSSQSLWDSDDFDFNFDDSTSNNQSGNWLSDDMQDQMRRQWRSWMFLTPDEAITKSNEDSDINLWNIDISSTVQPQQRSGMFLTPDEEANKEESQIEWKQYSFQWTDGNQGVNDVDSDDSYLAWIDPGDVIDSQDDISNNWQENTEIQDNDYSQDKLDDEIEDLISFWDEHKNDQWEIANQTIENSVEDGQDLQENEELNTDQLENQIGQSAQDPQMMETSSNLAGNGQDTVGQENSIQENENPIVQNVESVPQNVEPVSQDAEPVTQNTQTIQTGVATDDINSVVNSEWENTEDRLSQEDKKVEESFWSGDEPMSWDIDVSPENVSQNVENVISDSVNTAVQNIDSNIDSNIIWNVNSDINDQSVGQNDLHIENMWTDVVENGNWDLISDVWWMQQMNQENTYVPNEAEFTQMSNLLDSSNSGQIDLSNLDTEQWFVQQDQSIQNVIPENNLQNLWTETVQMENSMDNNIPTVQNDVVQSNLENNVNDELSQFDSVEPQNLQPEIPQEIQPVAQPEVQSEIQQEAIQDVVVNNPNPNSEINLDSLVSEIEPVDQTIVWNNDITNWTLIWSVNEWQVVNSVVQPVAQKKRKKQSWFKVLWIFLLVCVLLWVGVYVASKMFPEEFSKIINKNDPVVWFLVWDNEEVNIDENNIDENNIDEENIEEVGIEDFWDDVQEQEIDPDSLAGLLLWDEDWDQNQDPEISWDWEENYISDDEWEIDSETWESNEIWGDEEWWEDNWDFDPFAEINDILWEAQEYVDRLNAYAASGQYYLDWGESNGKQVVANVWRSIQNTAQGELTKLENWEEIDTSVFDRMDDLLKKLSDLTK